VQDIPPLDILFWFFYFSNGIKVSQSTAEVGGVRALASLPPAKGTDFLPDAVGGMKRF